MLKRSIQVALALTATAALLVLVLPVAAGPETPVVTPAAVPSPTIDYQFDGNLTDSAAGSTMTPAPNCTVSGYNPCNSSATFGEDPDGTYWAWQTTSKAGGGLRMTSSAAVGNTYTMALKFSFASVAAGTNGYSKIVDYRNRASDDGFYFQNGRLRYYPGTGASAGTYTKDTVLDLVTVRQSTGGSAGTFTVYMVGPDKKLTQLFVYNDTSGSSIPTASGAGSLFGFFFDDAGTANQQEATPAGRVYSVRVWSNQALTPAQLEEAVLPPVAPTNAAADRGDTQATISWDAVDGATVYTATASPGGATCTVDAPATTCDITGLTNGQTYAVTVVASDANGASAPSDPAEVTPGAAPGAPQSVTATAGVLQAEVSWTPPASDGGLPVESYTVTAAPGGQTCAIDAPDTSCVVGNLATGTPYSFAVTATNAAGTGPASSASNSVTPIPGTDPMVLQVDTRLTRGNFFCPANTMSVPLFGQVDVTINWGDGETTTVSEFRNPATNPTAYGHTYATAGQYTITITGSAPQYGIASRGFCGVGNLTEVTAFGELGTVQFPGGFNGAFNLTDVPSALPPGVTDTQGMFSRASAFNDDISGWNTSQVTTMASMFEDASVFNTPIGSWDVSSVTTFNRMFSDTADFDAELGAWDVSSGQDFNNMFANTEAFNSDIGAWDTSSATDLSFMFYFADVFSAEIGAWDTSNATNLSYMFSGAPRFNADLSGWDTSANTTMDSMFENASSFDADLSGWDTGNVTDMGYALRNATSFSADLSGWDTSSVTTMGDMFNGATSFDADLGAWDVSNVTSMSRMFRGAGLSTANYDATLIGWANLAGGAGVRANVPFDAGSSVYSCDAVAARATLTGSPNSWTITDGGIVPTPAAPTITGVTSGNRQLSVAFTPRCEGGSAITTYEVSLDGGETWGSRNPAGTTSPIVVGGLTNGVTYDVQIRAVNASGAGGWSGPAEGTPATVPDAPFDLVAARGDGEATIVYSDGDDGGSPITNHEYSIDGGGWVAFSPPEVGSPVIIEELTNGTPYSIRLRAVNAVGPGAASSPVSVTPATVPDPPTNLIATPGDAQATIAFTVGANGGSPLTNHQYSVDGGRTWTAFSPADTTSPVTISGLTNGETYRVILRAVNAVGVSAASEPVRFTLATVPDAPFDLVATPGDTEATIVYSDGDDGGSPITNHEYSIDGGGWVAFSPPEVGSPVIIEELTNGTPYSIRLRAVNALGVSVPSEPVTVTPVPGPVLPDAPTNLVPTPGDAQATIAFTPGADGGSPITNYEYSDDGGRTWTAFSPADTTSPVTISGLTNGETYRIVLRAVNAVGAGDASEPAIFTLPTIPDPPFDLVATGGNGEATIVFTEGDDGGSPLTNHECSIDGGDWVAFDPAELGSPVVIGGLVNGTTYSIRLRAVNALGVSDPSESVDVTPATVPEPPINLVATPGNGEATIDFLAGVNGGSPITNYEYSVDGGRTWTALSPTASTSPVTISGLTNGETYQVILRAVNAVGVSYASEPAEFTLATVPDAPFDLAGIPGNEQAEVEFENGADGGSPLTNHEYSIDGGDWQPFDPDELSSPVFFDGLTNGTTYEVRLRAVNAVGVSDPSEPVQVTPATIPDPPTELVATPGDRQATIAFTVGGDGGSPLTNHEYNINGGDWQPLDPARTGSPVVVSGLANGTTYEIRLRAVNAVGVSDPSEPVQVTPAAAPTPSPTPSTLPPHPQPGGANSAKGLPATGSDVSGLVGVGLLLVVVGAALATVRRRHHTARA
jgi:LPXTG-motif cell wall-anchored protein